MAKANFEIGTKVCPKCKRELPISRFNKDKSKSDGLNSRCKECEANYRKSESGKNVAKKARKKYYQTEKGKACQKRTTQNFQKTEKGKEVYKRSKKKYRESDRGIQRELEYRKSSAHKESQSKYFHSEKGKAALKRSNEKYEQTEKGKEVRRSVYMKRILNGKLNKYQNDKYKRDESYRIGKLLRTRIYYAIRNNCKSNHTLNLLGCSIEHLKQHLEFQFKEGMTWDNLGSGEKNWQIDHIIPCAKFDFSNPTHQRICFNYRNLQPLWAKENNKKKDNLPDSWKDLLEIIKESLDIKEFVDLK